uniref:Uncharacterized protein n=1 Tax=Oryza sativa subsp. japonica TaxID=39947 RepID=Q6ZIY4_ORYSJ|nr:hypothetical protein [Oryza sativa Japonica Group]
MMKRRSGLRSLMRRLLDGGRRPWWSADCRLGHPRGLVVTASPSSSSSPPLPPPSSPLPPPCSWVVVREREIEWRGRDRERERVEGKRYRERGKGDKAVLLFRLHRIPYDRFSVKGCAKL